MRELLRQLYGQHRQGLYTLALAIVRDPSRAEDAMQDAFVRLLKSGVRPGGDPAAYVFAAVRNAARDHLRLRHAQATEGQPASIYADPAPDPGTAATIAEDRQRLREAVDALADPEREVVVMKVYGGLTFEAIARCADEPLQTVASRYRRAMEALRRRLAASMRQ